MSSQEAAWCRSAPWRFFAQKVVLPWALQGVAPTGHVLEIGGGSGAMAEQVLLRYPDVRMTVTDVDPAMLDVAGERLRRFGERAAVEKADATSLPFADGTFDTVLSFIMLHHVVDWEGALRETVRVTQPGGRVVGYDLLATLPSRHAHHEHADQRLMQVDELRSLAATLPVSDAHIAPALGRLTVRFRFIKEG